MIRTFSYLFNYIIFLHLIVNRLKNSVFFCEIFLRSRGGGFVPQVYELFPKIPKFTWSLALTPFWAFLVAATLATGDLDLVVPFFGLFSATGFCLVFLTISQSLLAISLYFLK